MSHIQKAKNLYQLMRSQWKSFDQLKAIQDNKLRAMISYAYENVSFYQDKFNKAGVLPGDINTVEDLPKLPVTTKQEIKDGFPSRMIARGVDIKKCWLPHTSGSTGTPMTVAYDESAEDFQKAVALRPNISCGQGYFDKWVTFTDPRHITSKKLFQYFGLFNPTRISLFESLENQISLLQEIKPRILEAYPSHLYTLTRKIEELGAAVNPRIIFTTAELMDSRTREYVETILSAPIYDQFGGVELGRTAWQCPMREGYHIDTEAVVMEFVKDGQQVAQGETGEIVYTGLYNYAMPLIRYASGDMGKMANRMCSCGRGLPLMEMILGRKDDFLVGSNGSLVTPITMDLIFKNMMEIDECRVIQESMNLIIVQVVSKKPLNSNLLTEIDSGIKAVLGKDTVVKIKQVKKLEKDNSGKLRKVISKVKTSDHYRVV